MYGSSLPFRNIMSKASQRLVWLITQESPHTINRFLMISTQINSTLFSIGRWLTEGVRTSNISSTEKSKLKISKSSWLGSYCLVFNIYRACRVTVMSIRNKCNDRRWLHYPKDKHGCLNGLNATKAVWERLRKAIEKQQRAPPK